MYRDEFTLNKDYLQGEEFKTQFFINASIFTKTLIDQEFD